MKIALPPMNGVNRENIDQNINSEDGADDDRSSWAAYAIINKIVSALKQGGKWQSYLFFREWPSRRHIFD